MRNLPCRVALLLAAVLLFGGCGQKYGRGSEEHADNAKTMTLLLPRIGKADCAICSDGEVVVMIDCGESDDAEELIRKLGSEKLDLLIITHFDKDHLGAAAALIEAVEIARILEPDYAPEDPSAAEYVAYRAALSRYSGELTALRGEQTLTLGSMELTVRGAGDMLYEKNTDNNHSLFVTLKHAGNRFLFAGDAEKQRLRAELDRGVEKADFLKMPHHGSYNAALPDFLAAVEPSIAAITCSAKNPPDAKTLAALDAAGAEVYLTSDGDLRFLSTADGIRAIS